MTDSLDNNSPKKCLYVDSYGQHCQDPLFDNSNFCFWHDAKINKKMYPDTKQLLEQRAATGRPMRGFKLREADLQNYAKLIYKA